MAFNFKRTAAAATAIVCTAAMCGCMDTGKIGTVDGVEIRNGVYLYFLLNSYNEGYTEVADVKAEAGDTSEVADLFKETIDGKEANAWMKEKALESVKRYVAVQRLFEEKGLTLSADEKNAKIAEINSTWDTEDMYAQYIYGFDTMGEYYESIGIGKESMKELQLNSMMEEKVFLAYYDTDGEKAVSAEDINAYLKENYASIKYIEMPFENANGIDLTDEVEIQAVKDTAQSYVDRLNGGESFIDVKYDNDLKTAQEKAAAEADLDYAEETGEAVDYDSYIQAAVDAVTVEKAATEDELSTVISKESSSLDEEFTEYIWTLAEDGTATLFTTDAAAYVVLREDITANETWKTDNKSVVLDAMKGEEFEQLLLDTGAGYNADLDSYLVDNKYSPDKIKGTN